MTKRSSIGSRLRHDREALGLSQMELAVKVGLHRSTIGQVERGEIRDLGCETVARLAKGLKCDPSWLAWGE